MMDVETHNLPQSKVKSWLKAMRFRTLPLALSATITGVGAAALDTAIDWTLAGLTALCTILLQINSNLANDYGDTQQGADNDSRVGPARQVQSGAISMAAMKRGVQVFSFLSLLSGVLLLLLANIGWVPRLVLFVAGLAAIYASIKYTAGSNPYGYRGLGDVSVMVFFGVIGVAGAHFLQVGSWHWYMLLPAVAIGALSAGVLNLNNMRDRDGDQKAGKITLAIRLGIRGAKVYQLSLIIGAIFLFTLYGWLRFTSLGQWLFLIAVPLLTLHVYKVLSLSYRQYDPLLKQLALTTFLLSVLFLVGIMIAG